MRYRIVNIKPTRTANALTLVTATFSLLASALQLLYGIAIYLRATGEKASASQFFIAAFLDIVTQLLTTVVLTWISVFVLAYVYNLWTRRIGGVTLTLEDSPDV